MAGREKRDRALFLGDPARKKEKGKRIKDRKAFGVRRTGKRSREKGTLEY